MAKVSEEVKKQGLREFHLGQQEFSAGRLETALPHYLAALDLFDGDPDLYLERAVTAGQAGIACKGLNQMAQAVDYFGRAIAIFQKYPENADAMISLGNCFWHIGEIDEEAGDFDGARVAYNQAYAAYRSAPNTQERQVEVLGKLRTLELS
ncbi:Tetratricopeptide repeat-containing protein [Actinobaculum suis]|uniref:Tetratricopeptide repeat protein n=1 Tax=Actinobaculum suis TaxID=1657 RepID=A0A1G7A9P6_9ACTO|nr:tetratricopeptide repeat protein [Actinobaculum suis]MDY5152637.1 tetratricopeptide repeat protein [Actinobaculum suis]SDE11529.1 Tetratricopeptide repeat-containing protein [Actinobaculum suis]